MSSSSKTDFSPVGFGKRKSKSASTPLSQISAKFHANSDFLDEFNIVDEQPELLIKSDQKDPTSPDNIGDEASTDTWRFFTDIKEKFAKNVDNKKRSSLDGSPKYSSSNRTTENVSEDENSESTKDDSQLRSSNPELDTKVDNEKITSGPECPSPSAPPCGGLRQRFRLWTSKDQTSRPPKEGTVDRNVLVKMYNINVDSTEETWKEEGEDVDNSKEEEIESGIDALLTDVDSCAPDTTSTDKNSMLIQMVVDKIDNFSIDSDNVLNMRRVDGQQLTNTLETCKSKPSPFFAPQGYIDLRRPESNLITLRDLRNILIVFLLILLYGALYLYSPYTAGISVGLAIGGALSYAIAFAHYIHITTTTGYSQRSKLKSHNDTFLTDAQAHNEFRPPHKYEGWLNEYPENYDPATYHVSETQSVFVRLHGTLLRLSHTTAKIPKHALWNNEDSTKGDVSFSHHRIYNLLGAKIVLLPKDLTPVRLWSRKYPICIIFNSDQQMEYSGDEELKEDSVENSPEHITISSSAPTVFEFPNLSKNGVINTFKDSSATGPKDNCDEDDDENDNDDRVDAESLPDDWKIEETCDMKTKLYLFARCDREKEVWYRRLIRSAHQWSSPEEVALRTLTSNDPESLVENVDLEDSSNYLTLLRNLQLPPKREHSPSGDSDSNQNDQESEESCNIPKDPLITVQQVTKNPLWVNAFMARVLFDCLRNDDFNALFLQQLNDKLRVVKVFFLEKFSVIDLNLGRHSPTIHRISTPSIDDRGMWVEVDVAYEGSAVLTLQTKLNLMKLKQQPPPPLVTDDDELSSSDESPEVQQSPTGPAHQQPISARRGGRHGQRKLQKFVDRITDSRLFQAATEYRLVRKAMEGVSNTDLRLKVELRALSGTMVVNIAAPPSDRIWVGFKPKPVVTLSACPLVGDRNFGFLKIIGWFERRLLHEFEKLMVLPNMEDFYISVMSTKLPHGE